MQNQSTLIIHFSQSILKCEFALKSPSPCISTNIYLGDSKVFVTKSVSGAPLSIDVERCLHLNEFYSSTNSCDVITVTQCW